MCGIAGISWSESDKAFSTRDAAVSLLKGIASRGPDATGAAWYQPVEDAVALTKVPVPAWRFIEAREERIPADTPTMILHTRFATHGSVHDRVNNHPIQHGNIVGVHNGVLQNDNEIFEDLDVKREGEVDSEAIFALVNAVNEEVEGMHLTQVFSALLGDAAVAWIDIRNPESLHLAKVVGRPLYTAQTPGGSLVFASTQKAVDDTIKAIGLSKAWGEEMKEGHYMRVVAGVIMDYLPLEGIKARDEAWSKQYAYTSGTTPASPNRQSVNKDNKESVVPDDDDESMWAHEKLEDDLIKSGKVGRRAKTEYTQNAINYLERYMKEKTDDELEVMSGDGSEFAAEELQRRRDMTPMFKAPTPKEVFATKQLAVVK